MGRIASGTRCDRFVAETLQAEAEAHALELELRRQLGAPPNDRVLPFADAYWQAPAARRVAVIRDHLEAHPAGSPGLPGFARLARSRCEQLRSPPSDPARRRGARP